MQLAILLGFLLCGGAAAPPDDPRLAALAPVTGKRSSDLVLEGDTVLDVAYRNRLGFDRLSRLNPGVRLWLPEPGRVVQLPTEHVLPEARARGLVVNIPEMQLYDFTVPDGPEVFAIAIGDGMDPSLVGSYRVGVKRENPTWRVPASIRAEKPELPAVVPPGPANPLGTHWITIGNTSYGIHGTNNQWSIGRQATHGCIRLYDDEMARLYARIPVRTPIQLVYQTVKLGRRGNEIVIEVHPDLYGRDPDRADRIRERIHELGLDDVVDSDALRQALEEERGAPTTVGVADAHTPVAEAE